MYAKRAYGQISEIVNPFFLKKFGKSNARKLTEEENTFAEDFKFNLLYNIEPYTEITTDVIQEKTSSSLITYKDLDNHMEILKSTFIKERERIPDKSEIEQFRSYIYAMINMPEEVIEDD